MEKNAKSVVSKKNYYSLSRGRVRGGGTVEALHPQCDLLQGEGRRTCTTKHFLQREFLGAPLKVPAENHCLPFFSPFLAPSSLGTGLAPSAHSPPRPGAELAIP